MSSYFSNLLGSREKKHHSINTCGKFSVSEIKGSFTDITKTLPHTFYIIGNSPSGEDRDTCFEFDKSKHSIYIKESHKTSKSASKKGGRKGTRKHKKTRKHK